MTNAATISCINCSKIFAPWNDHQKACSVSCGQQHRSLSRPKFTYNCQTCDKECSVILSRANKAKFCSLSCRGTALAKLELGHRFKSNDQAAYKTVNKYQAIHLWIRKYWGKAITCEFCNGTKSSQFEWANKSGDYDRYNRSDWLQLCKKCHWGYDRKAYYGG